MLLRVFGPKRCLVDVIFHTSVANDAVGTLGAHFPYMWGLTQDEPYFEYTAAYFHSTLLCDLSELLRHH